MVERILGRVLDRNMWMGFIIFVGIAAFDVFNFATTSDALDSFNLGDFMGVSMSVALAVAFCAIDLGGLASLFTKEKGFEEPWWVWMLGFGWLVASAANAVLTWWAVLIGMEGAPAINNPVISPTQLYTGVPIALAMTVWLIRLLLIGSTVAAWNKPQKKYKPQFRPQLGPIPQKLAPQKPKQPEPRPQGTVSIASPFGD